MSPAHAEKIESTAHHDRADDDDEDDKELEDLGYVPSFKREFSNLATVRFFFPLQFRTVLSTLLACNIQISFAFSIM